MFKIYNMKQKIIHIILYIAVLFVCVSITGYLKPAFKEGMNTFYDNRPSSKKYIETMELKLRSWETMENVLLSTMKFNFVVKMNIFITK